MAKPTGRPSSFTQKKADIICKRLENGESLRKICKDADMPDHSTVSKWLKDVVGFSTQYVRAREVQADAIFDDCLEIADKKDLTNEEIQQARLRIDTRKWIAGKLRPKKYGEKLDVEHGGKVNVVIAKDDKDLL